MSSFVSRSLSGIISKTPESRPTSNIISTDNNIFGYTKIHLLISVSSTMMLFIPLLCLLSKAFAEPPVDDGYPAARSHDHYNHAHSELTRSPSQEYGPPRTFGTSRNVLSTEYSIPNSKSSLSNKYGLPNARSSSLSSDYDPLNARTASSRQKYAPAAARISFSQTYSLKTQGLAKSASQEYELPDSRNAPSEEYGPPNAHSELSQNYGTSRARNGISDEYGTPNTRSRPSEEYRVPKARSGISQKYGTPNTRSGSPEYEIPSTRNGEFQGFNAPAQPSQEYGAPELSSRSLSTEYGVPDARSTPSEEYGAPAVARSGIIKSTPKSSGSTISKSSLHSSQGYSSRRSFPLKSLSQVYAAPSARSNELSQSYSAPKSSAKSVFGSRSQSSSYAAQKKAAQTYNASAKLQSPSYAPSTRDSDSYSQEYKTPSESYGVPAAKDFSDTYGVPNTNGLSQEYEAPSSHDSLKTNAFVSSYSSARSSPSSTYVPSSRGVMPSEQYGVPEQYDAQSNQGYNYARSALDESNQEPANYDFAYKVNDYESGSDFGHAESRQENHAEGSYFVVLPDGTKQTVEYEADERGFKPRISVEPAASARNGGYDDNASDLARSDGPY